MSGSTSVFDPSVERFTLRDARLTRGMTSSEAANLLGVHPMTVLKWERRERLPEPSRILALATVLDVQPRDVVSFFDEARPAAVALGVPGQGLRQLRRQGGVTVRRIAEATQVLPSSVYNWEAGRCRIPDALVPQLATVLGYPEQLLVTVLRAGSQAAPRAVPVLARSGLHLMRARAGLSQHEAAQRMGVSRYLIRAWEDGRRRPPLWGLRRLADAYETSISTVAKATGVVAPATLDPNQWDRQALKDVLRTLREWAGLTQAEVVVKCGRSAVTVRAWEAGRYQPDAQSRAALARLYGVPERGLPS